MVLAENTPLYAWLQRYTEALMSMMTRASACNRIHPAPQWLALWLLLAHDRMGADRFPTTHEFMAQVMGVRRATVTDEARRLQDAGTIDYRRGILTVTDRRTLEAAA